MSLGVPNFRNMSILVFHPADRNVAALSDQLKRLEAQVLQQWPPDTNATLQCDALFFDVDRGYDGMFPWRKNQAPVPTIAMIGSETPGRLEWVIDQRPCAYLLKPIGSHGVFQALTIACHAFREERDRALFIETTLQRVHARPVVVKAILHIVRKYSISDDDAFGVLRSGGMRLQVTVERYAQMIADGATPEPSDFNTNSRHDSRRQSNS